MTPKLYYLIYILVLALAFMTPQSPSYAQTSAASIAKGLPLDIETIDGDIICLRENELTKCNSSYSSEIVGVVTKKPSAMIEYVNEENIEPITTDGVARVRVSTSNGAISEGDLITTSDTEGVGQKATENGYVVGIAMENYQSPDTTAISSILVTINIHPAASFSNARSNLLELVRRGISAPLFEPLAAMRYILAALIIFVAFTVGFLYFGRVSKSGVEAIGRNPMAAKMIQFSVLMHVIVTSVIVLVGLFISYLILIL